MILRFLINVLAALSLLPASSYAQANFHRPEHCNAALTRTLDHQSSFEKALRSKLFYSDPRPNNYDSRAFYASNEDDWFRGPWYDSATDVVIGFGTNSAWDIATRRKAKQLIIADWHTEPLIGQYYILAPLLRLAKSPIEFMYLIHGMNYYRESTKSSFLHATSDLANDIVRRQAEYDIHTRAKEIDKILKRLQGLGVTQEQLFAIEAYLIEQNKLTLPMHDHYGIFRGEKAHSLGNLALLFNVRYNPHELLRNGASPELIRKKDFSFLSSQSSFDRLKRLFAQVQLAQSDFMDAQFYQKIKEQGDLKGFKKYTISISNIMDANNMFKTDAIKSLNDFRKMIYEVFPAGQYEVTIHFTSNFRQPHGFYILDRETPTPSDQDWVRTDIF